MMQYIAGFFDGEGSIGIYHKIQKSGNISFCLRTQLTNNKTKQTEKLFKYLLSTFSQSALPTRMARLLRRSVFVQQLSISLIHRPKLF